MKNSELQEIEVKELKTKIDWARKLTSRKFWLAIVGFVSAILFAFNVAESDVTQIVGIIMSGASVIAYVIAEGLVDSSSNSTIIELDAEEDESEGE